MLKTTDRTYSYSTYLNKALTPLYDSELSDKERHLIASHFELQDKCGAKSIHSKRHIVNVIFYLNKAGCQGRMLPKKFLPWQTVYDHYSPWNRHGVWEVALDALNA